MLKPTLNYGRNDDGAHDQSAIARLVAYDVVGVVAWGALLLWVVRAARTPQDSVAVRDLLLVVAAVYVLARILTALHPVIVPAVLLVLGTTLAVYDFGGLVFRVSVDPVGYPNATAALMLAAVTAGLMTWSRSSTHEVRWAALGGAATCAIIPWLFMAVTSAVQILVLPFALFARQLGSSVRSVVATAAIGAMVAIAATAVIGVTFDGNGIGDSVISSTLSSNRALLWRDALVLLWSNPERGIGTGRFAEESPMAWSDDDLSWAHSDYLQLGAETGVPGLLLLAALVLWAFGRMWVGRRDAATAVAAAGLAGLSIAASVDYVWHFPEVAMVTAAIAGAGVLAGTPSRAGATDVPKQWDLQIDDERATSDAAWPRRL